MSRLVFGRGDVNTQQQQRRIYERTGIVVPEGVLAALYTTDYLAMRAAYKRQGVKTYVHRSRSGKLRFLVP